MKEFTVKMGLHNALKETHDVEQKERGGTFEHGSKCIDVALVSEGMLKIVEVIDLIECIEIVDSDHRDN